MVNGALTDAAVLAPFTTTPAGSGLITALRRPVAQQQQVLSARQPRHARTAAIPTIDGLHLTRRPGRVRWHRAERAMR